jgi:DNA-binding XRE family transcriptional regulator
VRVVYFFLFNPYQMVRAGLLFLVDPYQMVRVSFLFYAGPYPLFVFACSAMPRQLAPSYALLTAVRTHFALTQAELARYLGISSEHLFSVENGHRRLGSTTERRLASLLDHLPPPR